MDQAQGDCNYLEHFSHPPRTIKNLRIFSVIKHQSTPSSFRNFTLKFQHFPPRRLKSYFTAPLPPSRPRSNPSPRVHPSPLSRIHLHPPILFDPSTPTLPMKTDKSYQILRVSNSQWARYPEMKSRAPPVVTRVRNTGTGWVSGQGQKASLSSLLFFVEIEVEPLYGDTGSILGCFHRT